MGIDAYFCALHPQKNLPCTEILEHQVSNDLYEAQVEIRSYSSLGAIVYHISGNHRLEQKELPNENYQVLNWVYPFSTYPKIPEKLTFLTPDTHT